MLYRSSNAQSRVFEEALLIAGVPYRVYGGMRFFERAEVKDALAYLRLIANRDDDPSFERIVNVPTRGIGARTVDAVRRTARGMGVSLWRAAAAVIGEERIAKRSATSLLAFSRLIDQLDEATRSMSLGEQVEHVIHASGLIDHHKNDKLAGESRVEKLTRARQRCAGIRRRRRFRVAAARRVPVLRGARIGRHAGRGLRGQRAADDAAFAPRASEFPVVFVCGLEDGLFPHQRSASDAAGLEEERRLCYVGPDTGTAAGLPDLRRAAPALWHGSLRYAIEISSRDPARVARRGAAGTQGYRGPSTGDRLSTRWRHPAYGSDNACVTASSARALC